MKKSIIFGLGVVAMVATVGFNFYGSVSVKGSDTLLILNQRWAEAYGQKGGGSVDVTGGGSSIGINAFINGVADVCASSRPMRASEVAKARSRGSIVNEIPVALDGLAIAVNKNNPGRLARHGPASPNLHRPRSPTGARLAVPTRTSPCSVATRTREPTGSSRLTC